MARCSSNDSDLPRTRPAESASESRYQACFRPEPAWRPAVVLGCRVRDLPDDDRASATAALASLGAKPQVTVCADPQPHVGARAEMTMQLHSE
jgi:hypothetical protein